VQGIRKERTTKSCGEGEAQKGKDGTKWNFGPLGAYVARDNDETHFKVED
jgi:hypothetical protein